MSLELFPRPAGMASVSTCFDLAHAIFVGRTSACFHMIVVQLTGGLGNQLFQYAFARHLAQRNKSELFIDTTQVESRSDPAHRRKYKLHHFCIQSPLVDWDSPFGNSFQTEMGRFSRGSVSRLARFFGRRRHLAELSEPHFHFDPEVLKRRGDFYVTTYWQSHRYFDAIAPKIRSDLALREPLSHEHQVLKDQIQADASSVALIVRRGDFANHPHHSKFHGCCSHEYYQQAQAMIRSRVANPHLYVFSDDIPWVRENMQFECPVTFMDQSYDHIEYDYVDMHLISCCRHHIIANSTFGWWGAWLASAEEGIVIAPKRWFLDASINTQDVVPPQWLRL